VTILPALRLGHATGLAEIGILSSFVPDSVCPMGGSYISATTGEIRGIPAAEPVLQVTFDLEAGGLSDGTSALFVISAFLQGDGGGPIILGTAAPVVMQLGFSAREGGDEPYKTQVAAQWTLSDAAIERIERKRNGGAMTLWPNFQYALINLGTIAPDWPPAAAAYPSAVPGTADIGPDRRAPVGARCAGAMAARGCGLAGRSTARGEGHG
jgi:hypothetical protein